MPVKLRDNQIARSMMVLCFGTAGLLLASQWTPLTNRFHSNLGTAIGILRKPPATSQTAGKPNPATKDARLVVDLSDRKVTLYKKTRSLGNYAIGVAKEGWETPIGSFNILDMERNPTWIHPITNIRVPPGTDNPLGKAWIGFWTDGNTEIGFHGTNEEDLIGQAVSHGCLRMRNQDIEAIYTQVGYGTPVVVQP
jgi:L,D-transpeptidase ErfK/SrfK